MDVLVKQDRTAVNKAVSALAAALDDPYKEQEIQRHEAACRKVAEEHALHPGGVIHNYRAALLRRRMVFDLARPVIDSAHLWWIHRVDHARAKPTWLISSPWWPIAPLKIGDRAICRPRTIADKAFLATGVCLPFPAFGAFWSELRQIKLGGRYHDHN